MSSTPAVGKVSEYVNSVKGLFDVERQLQGVTIKPRKAGYGKKTTVAFNAWLASGSPEGTLPTVIVRDAVLGSVGKASEHRRGFDQYSFPSGNGSIVTTSLAVGMNSTDHTDMKDMLSGIFDKFVASRHPVARSKFYQDSFPERIQDGTQVFTATQALLNPSEFASMDFQDDANMWDSPGRTWGSFLFGGDESSTPWYTKTKVDENCTVYLFTSKNKQIQTTKENDQVVYPRGGIEVKNTNMLRTLMSSALYKGKQWRVSGSMALTGIEFVCGEVGQTAAGSPRYAIAPVFRLKTTGTIVLTEHDKADDGGLTPEQFLAAQFAAVMQGKVAPPRKRKIKEQIEGQGAVVSTFNGSGKKKKARIQAATEVEEEATGGAGFDESGDEDSDGEVV